MPSNLLISREILQFAENKYSKCIAESNTTFSFESNKYEDLFSITVRWTNSMFNAFYRAILYGCTQS